MSVHRSHFSGRIPGLEPRSPIDRLIARGISEGIPMEQIELEIIESRQGIRGPIRKGKSREN